MLERLAIPEMVVPFEHFPQVYGMRVVGDCCAPHIPDGAHCAFDQDAKVTGGDFVIIWIARTHDGVSAIRPMVKRLLFGMMDGIRLPYVHRSGNELEPVLFFETLNPPRQFRADCRFVYGIHKCIHIVANPAETGRADLMELPIKRVRKPHVAGGLHV